MDFLQEHGAWIGLKRVIGVGRLLDAFAARRVEQAVAQEREIVDAALRWRTARVHCLAALAHNAVGGDAIPFIDALAKAESDLAKAVAAINSGRPKP
jgi:hypothetical protein